MDNYGQYGYPLETIFNTINRRLKKLFVQKVKPATSANNFDIDTNSNIKRKIIVFSYIRSFSELVTSVINRIHHRISLLQQIKYVRQDTRRQR